jgi:hypothetical protein
MVSRESHEENTVFDIGQFGDAAKVSVGGTKLAIMAGLARSRTWRTRFTPPRSSQIGCDHPARRRLQTAHFALRLQGLG